MQCKPGQASEKRTAAAVHSRSAVRTSQHRFDRLTLYIEPRNIYILTCADPFTKRAEVFPIIPTKTPKLWRKALVDQVFARFEVPIALLSDQGKFHGTLNAMIGKVVREKQANSDAVLPFVISAYRARRHDTPGYDSPNLLTLGRETWAPVDLVFNLPSAEEPAKTYYDYVENLDRRMRNAYVIVRKELDHAFDMPLGKEELNSLYGWILSKG